MEMILTGKMYTAKEMFDAGMVSKVVDDEVFLEEAQAIGKRNRFYAPYCGSDGQGSNIKIIRYNNRRRAGNTKEKHSTCYLPLKI